MSQPGYRQRRKENGEENDHIKIIENNRLPKIARDQKPKTSRRLDIDIAEQSTLF